MRMIRKPALVILDCVMYCCWFVLSPILYITARVGYKKIPMCTSLFDTLKTIPLKYHYYTPVMERTQIEKLYKNEDNYGKSVNDYALVDRLIPNIYRSELLATDLHKNNTDDYFFGFRFGNGSFETGDVEFLYQVIRFLKPKSVIEIGGGNSTKIIAEALARNVSEKYSEGNVNHVCIEPYEMPWLERMPVVLHRSRVQDIDISIYDKLDNGDLLFIDTSHIMKPGGDLVFLYNYVLPRLKQGVIIHIHDIFLPYEYPVEWLVERRVLWNEQYLLQSILSNTSRYKVVAPLHEMYRQQFESLKLICPYISEESCPGSFYLQVT